MNRINEMCDIKMSMVKLNDLNIKRTSIAKVLIQVFLLFRPEYPKPFKAGDEWAKSFAQCSRLLSWGALFLKIRISWFV